MIIYKTINLISGDWYIGQDSKNNPNYLGGGIILKRAIKKYGRNNFVKEILQSLPDGSTKNDLNAAEIIWINKTDAVNNDRSYNIALGGSDVSSNPEVGAKISKKMKGNKNGVGKRPNVSGILWKGKRGSEHHLYGISSPKKGSEVSKETRTKQAISNGAKTFVMVDRTSGTIVGEYLIVAECAKENGLHRSNIQKCLRNKLKSTGGYFFKYKGKH